MVTVTKNTLTNQFAASATRAIEKAKSKVTEGANSLITGINDGITVAQKVISGQLTNEVSKQRIAVDSLNFQMGNLNTAIKGAEAAKEIANKLQDTILSAATKPKAITDQLDSIAENLVKEFNTLLKSTKYGELSPIAENTDYKLRIGTAATDTYELKLTAISEMAENDLKPSNINNGNGKGDAHNNPEAKIETVITAITKFLSSAANARDTLKSYAQTMTGRVDIATEIAKQYTDTDIVEASQAVQEGASKMSLGLSMIQVGETIKNQTQEAVKYMLSR